MPDDATKGFSFPPEMQALVEQNMANARKAFEDFLSVTQRAVASAESHAAAGQAGIRDMASTAVTFAQRNVASSFELAQKLAKARSPQEALEMHAEYVKAQVAALNSQARELSEVAARATRPKTD